LFEKNYPISIFPNLFLHKLVIPIQKIPEAALCFKDFWFLKIGWPKY